MPARLSAFVTWALVAAGLMFWGYRLFAKPAPAPASVHTVGESAGARADLSRLLGAAPVAASEAPVPVVESSRFRLLGVLAPAAASDAGKASSTAGVALIAVDGKPARPFAVGARLEGDMVLQAVSRRSASIGLAQAAPSLVLELPPPAPPATGTLPRAMADGTVPARPLPPMQAPMAPPRPQPIQQQPQPEDEADEPDEQETVAPARRGGSGNKVNR